METGHRGSAVSTIELLASEDLQNGAPLSSLPDVTDDSQRRTLHGATRAAVLDQRAAAGQGGGKAAGHVPWYIVSHQSALVERAELAMLVLVFYLVVIIPLEASLQPFSRWTSAVLEGLVTLGFAMYMGLQFITTVETTDRILDQPVSVEMVIEGLP